MSFSLLINTILIFGQKWQLQGRFCRFFWRENLACWPYPQYAAFPFYFSKFRQTENNQPFIARAFQQAIEVLKHSIKKASQAIFISWNSLNDNKFWQQPGSNHLPSQHEALVHLSSQIEEHC